MKRFMANLSISIIITILLIEIAGQIIVPNFLCLSELFRRVDDPKLVYMGKPYAKATYNGMFSKIRPVQIELNSRGFRDEEPKAGDTREKIMIMGDSNTVGMGVEQDAIFPILIKNDLSEFNVLNMGIAGYNFAQEFNLFKSSSHNYRMVIFVIYTNDFSDVIGVYKKPPFFFLLRHVFIYRVYFAIRHVALIESNTEGKNRGYNNAVEILDAMRDKGSGICFVILQRPPFDFSQFEEKARNNYIFIDAEDIYLKRHFQKDSHLDKEGHRLVAERILETIKPILNSRKSLSSRASGAGY